MNQYVKNTINMAWPAVLESVSISIAGFIDTLMVSSIGSDAVAAVGLTTQPKFLGLAFFIATNVAVSALVARRKGQGKKREANQILFSALILTIVAGILISIICVGFADGIMRFSGSEEATHDYAVGYFKIIMGGMMFNIITMLINAAQRGAGNTRIAMRTNLVSNGINIVFNYLLINGNLGFPKLGIKGAAIATVIGTIVACIMSIGSLYKSEFLGFKELICCEFRKVKDSLIGIFKISYSVFIEQILLRIGFMAVAIMAAKQGSDGLAAHQVAMNIMSLAFSFGDGMQSATVTLIGQSLGRNEPENAKLYRKISLRIGNIMSVIFAVVYLLLGGAIYGLFFEEQHIIDIGIDIMRLMIFIVLFQIIQVINMGCLRGAGDVLFTTFTSTISVTIIRPLASYIMCYGLGLGIMGIWIGVLMDQVCRFTLTTFRFRNDKWTKIKI